MAPHFSFKDIWSSFASFFYTKSFINFMYTNICSRASSNVREREKEFSFDLTTDRVAYILTTRDLQ